MSSPNEDDHRGRKRLLLPAAGVGVAVLVAVAVYEGRVDVGNEHGHARVAAGPAAVTDVSAPVVERPAEPEPAPGRRRASPEQRREHAATRRRIEDALARRAQPSSPSSARADEPPPSSAPPEGELRAEVFGRLDKEYIRTAIEEDLIPLARECYTSVLETEPEFGGRLVLELDIMGDEDVGGIVDAVVPGEGTDMIHPDFVECMSESMMTVRFPPPEGGGVVHVRYPFVFEPG